jgi:hypothetical protein
VRREHGNALLPNDGRGLHQLRDGELLWQPQDLL